MKKKYIAVAPGNAATGGVELLHQLVDSINKFSDNQAFICHYPFGKRFELSKQYEKYNCPIIEFESIDKDHDVIILPEVYTHLTNKFNIKNIYLWWMSVDNYRNSHAITYALRNRFAPWKYIDIIRGKSKLQMMGGHLCQSEYAKLFLQSYGIHNTLDLSDYINEDYVLSSSKYNNIIRKSVVVYNPAKGIHQTRILMNSLPDVNFVPVVNMSREKIIELLGTSKIYIDFGNHPGKDRIPREAAILGCCVITNRKGSAYNSVDIPIPDAYKIDDTTPDFCEKAKLAISNSLATYDKSIIDFDSYRSKIINERKKFISDIKELISR